jgi:hypothetical protein
MRRHAYILISLLALAPTWIHAAGAIQKVRIPPEDWTPKEVLNTELDWQIRAYHPKRMVVLLSDPRSGFIIAAASKDGKILSQDASLREASHFHFNPGGLLEPFTLKELKATGIHNLDSVTALDLIRLISAVAEGGILYPAGRRVIDEYQAEPRCRSLINLVEGKHSEIPLARIYGTKVAGAAGHGGANPVTACFAGYFPADSPRHACVVAIEGADVILKFQRGSLLAAPVFSFIGKKILSIEMKTTN